MPENRTNQIYIRKRDLISSLSSMLGQEGGLTDKTARCVRRAATICEKQLENRKYMASEIEALLGKQMKRTEMKLAMSAVEKCFESAAKAEGD